MSERIETEREEDGRWIAELLDHPGVMAYGATEQEAIANARKLLQPARRRQLKRR